MDAAITATKLTKRFGNVQALTDLDLEVPRGSVFGLLGRNGAGKTTAIRIFMGLLRPTSGSAGVLGGSPLDGDESRMARIGYMSATLGFPVGMTVGEAAAFCRGLYPKWDDDYERQLLTELELDVNRRINSLSAGQERRVGLLLALSHRPELLVLDEPAANLDAVVRREFLEHAVELMSDEGTTIFYSSHVLSDVERIASHVAILDRGRLMLNRRLDDLLEAARRIRISLPEGADPASISVPGEIRRQRLGSSLLVTVLGDAEEPRPQLPEGTKTESMPIGLEDLFVDLTREEVGS